MSDGPAGPTGEPPRVALYVLFAFLVIVLITVFAVVGAYGT